MAKPRRMPKVSSERLQDSASKPAFPDLVTELAVDGLRWADAEIVLAKAEAGVLLRGYITGLAVALVGHRGIHRRAGDPGAIRRDRADTLSE